MKVENVKISDLKFADYNPRKLSDEDFNSLKRSINIFGFVEPVVVNKNNQIVGGHMRVHAAQALGWTEVPVVYVDLDSEQEKILNLALNRIHGEWDMDKLAEIVYKLQSEGKVDLSLTGFTAAEISQLIDSVAGAEDEFDTDSEIDRIGNEPESKLGQIWQMGEHRLMCGDSTNPAQVDALIAGAKIDMVWTDPPYNVNYTSAAKKGKGKAWKQAYGDDGWNEEEYEEFLFKCFSNFKQHLKPGGVFYLCSGWSSWAAYWRTLMKLGYKPRGCIMWDKGHGGMGWSDYTYQTELIAAGFNAEIKEDDAEVYDLIAYGFDDTAKHYFSKRKFQVTDVWRINRDITLSYKHPTQKPVKLVENALKNSSKLGDSVLDLFGGSGSCMAACVKNHRKSYTMELSPVFCDVIKARYKKITGEDPVLVQ